MNVPLNFVQEERIAQIVRAIIADRLQGSDERIRIAIEQNNCGPVSAANAENVT